MVPVSGTSCGTSPITPDATALTILDSDHTLGAADAPITVIEYANFHCSWCGRFERSDFPTIKAQYIDTGRVRWVFRHYISLSDSATVLAASASECAGDQGAYYEYRELIYQNQADQSEETLKQHATSLGLDRTVFDACLDGGTKVDRIRQDLSSAAALGVNSTPRFFVDNEEVRGYQTADALSQILEQHLAGG